MKLVSSLLAVAMSTSLVVNAEESGNRWSKMSTEKTSVAGSTYSNLIMTGKNVIINTGNLGISLSNNVASLPGATQGKVKEYQECIQERFVKFEKYMGAKSVGVIGCSIGSGVDSVLTLARKVTDGVFEIATVPAKTLQDLGITVRADVDAVGMGLDDEDLQRIPFLNLVSIGYIFSAWGMGLATENIGKLIQVVAEGGQSVGKLLVNGVNTGIKVATDATIVIVDTTGVIVKAMGTSSILVVTDVAQSIFDLLDVSTAGLTNAQCFVNSAATKGFKKAWEKIERQSLVNRKTCQMHELNAGKVAARVILTLVTLPARALDATFHEIMIGTNKNDGKEQSFKNHKNYKLNLRFTDEMTAEELEQSRRERDARALENATY